MKLLMAKKKLLINQKIDHFKNLKFLNFCAIINVILTFLDRLFIFNICLFKIHFVE